jgi:hypothetical protein
MALLFGQHLLEAASPVPFKVVSPASQELPPEREVLLGRLGSLAFQPRRDAELYTIRGMLHLETGAIREAGAAFRAALAQWSSDDAVSAVARHYLHLLERDGSQRR